MSNMAIFDGTVKDTTDTMHEGAVTMNKDIDRSLPFALAAMRLSMGIFFLVWAAEKIIAPEIARRVAETFYFTSPSDEALMITGILQVVLILAFMMGLFRFWTYGALLVIHTMSVLSTVPRLIDPFTLPNHLFWAGVPLVALLLALFVLRDRDTALVVGRTGKGRIRATAF